MAAPCSTVFHTISGFVASNNAGAFALVSPPTKRIRLVRIRPGMSAFTVMPSAAQRLAASTVNRMFAVLDWLYAFHGS